MDKWRIRKNRHSGWWEIIPPELKVMPIATFWNYEWALAAFASGGWWYQPEVLWYQTVAKVAKGH